LVERPGAREAVRAHDQVFPPPRRQPVPGGVADRALRAGRGAVGAEQAAAEIEPEAAVVLAQRIGRAGVDAGAAAVPAQLWEELRRAAKPIGQRGRLVGESHRPVPLLEASEKDVQHRRSYRSCPQYDRLKLLLHSGKSEICCPRRAIASPAQLWNDGSTTL